MQPCHTLTYNYLDCAQDIDCLTIVESTTAKIVCGLRLPSPEMLQRQQHGFGMFQPSIIRDVFRCDDAWLEITKFMLLPLEVFRANS